MTCTGSGDCSIIYTDPANDGGWITIELQARTLIRTIVFLAHEESNESYQTGIVSVKSIGDNSDPYETTTDPSETTKNQIIGTNSYGEIVSQVVDLGSDGIEGTYIHWTFTGFPSEFRVQEIMCFTEIRSAHDDIDEVWATHDKGDSASGRQVTEFTWI